MLKLRILASATHNLISRFHTYKKMLTKSTFFLETAVNSMTRLLGMNFNIFCAYWELAYRFKNGEAGL